MIFLKDPNMRLNPRPEFWNIQTNASKHVFFHHNTDLIATFKRLIGLFSHIRVPGIGILAKYSSQLLSIALLLVGLSFVITSASAQTYSSPVTVSVDAAGTTAGLPGYIGVYTQRVDNSTHAISAMPNYDNKVTKGWLMVGSDTVYYGVYGGNAFYKEGLNEPWVFIFSSNSYNVTFMTAINTDNTIGGIKWYIDDTGSDIQEIQGQSGTATEVISGEVNDMTSNGTDSLYISKATSPEKVRAYCINQSAPWTSFDDLTNNSAGSANIDYKNSRLLSFDGVQIWRLILGETTWVALTGNNVSGNDICWLNDPGTSGTWDFALGEINSGQDYVYIYHENTVSVPDADFTGTPTSGTAPLTVNYTDQSSNSPDSWSWDFGDGGSSTLQNPSHVYTSAGTYTVSMTATNSAGSDTEVKTNYITVNEPAPVADFTGTPTSGDAPLLVVFTDASSGNITSWNWDFGDGNTSTQQNPSNNYVTAGTYTVVLTVTGPGGSDTKTRTNYITVTQPAPVADFTGDPTSGNAPLDVDFTDQSSNDPDTWDWDFGDGGSSTLQNPDHTYTVSGTYTVILTVTNDGGSDTKTRIDYIAVNVPPAPPVAGFSGDPTSGDYPLDVDFTDESTGSITDWSWDFGDGGSSTQQNPDHTYYDAGTYTVTLTVTGPGGSDTETKVDYITVNTPAPPACEFSGDPTSGDNPLDVDFTDESTGTIDTWSWDFGDGGSSTQQNPSHTYYDAGTYTVTLTVTGPGGSDDETKTDYITVSEAAPVAEFSGDPTSGDVPLDVQFTDESTGDVNSWDWNFGDGENSNEQNPSHTYTSTGVYTVTFTVTGDGGSDTETKTDYISVNEPSPTAQFSATPTTGEAPLEVQFTDESTGNVTSWDWDFGDGNTSTEQHPVNIYQTPGNFTVNLTVTGTGGSTTETKIDYILIPVGINHAGSGSIKIYPNPATNKLQIKFETPAKRSLTIFDANGKPCITAETDVMEFSVDISKLNNGIYLINITENNHTIKEVKIIKR